MKESGGVGWESLGLWGVFAVIHLESEAGGMEVILLHLNHTFTCVECSHMLNFNMC